MEASALLSTIQKLGSWKLILGTPLLVFSVHLFIRVIGGVWPIIRRNRAISHLPSPPCDDWLHGHASRVSLITAARNQISKLSHTGHGRLTQTRDKRGTMSCLDGPSMASMGHMGNLITSA